jgi:hypothetical protein
MAKALSSLAFRPSVSDQDSRMIHRTSVLSLSALGLVACIGCRKSPPSSSPAPVPTADVAAPAQDNPNQIVVTQRTAILPEPDAKAKSIAVVQSGETLVFLGDSADSPTGKNESFYKVKLSDGTEGWARNYGLILGHPGAVLLETPVYQRPTILAPLHGKLPLGQLVGVQGSQDDFVRVSASRWQSGWVRKSDISTDPADVLAAALVGPAMAKKTGKAALEAALAVLTDRSSGVAKAFQAKLDSLNGPGSAAETPAQPVVPAPPDSVKPAQ